MRVSMSTERLLRLEGPRGVESKNISGGGFVRLARLGAVSKHQPPLTGGSNFCFEFILHPSHMHTHLSSAKLPAAKMSGFERLANLAAVC